MCKSCAAARGLKSFCSEPSANHKHLPNSKPFNVVMLAAALSMTPVQPTIIAHGGGSVGGFAAGSEKSLLWGLFAPPRAYAAEGQSKSKVKWTCPMHPHYIADEFGACPICGMDLVKLQTSDAGLDGSAAESRTIVTVSPEVMQSMGVRLAKVEQPKFGRSITSFGIVRENERLQSEITARVEGWIDKLSVTAVGDEVKKGSLLFELYSPRLIVAQNDFLNGGSTRGGNNRGRVQLRSFGVQERAIKLIKRRKRPLEKIPFFAEQSGTISELNLNQGTYVKRGMMLAKIQNYKTVWLIASVSEKDLGFIARNTRARVTFPNLPGYKGEAKVDYIYPTIDSKTRTGQVRLILENPKGVIRPGSYADVTFETASRKRLAVPTEAILRSGEGQFVVVSLGKGRFEPRPIERGLVSGRWTEVKKGLKDNEDIVVSGQFLIDSESALRESFRKLERLQLPLSLLKLSKSEFAMIDHLVDAALYLHEALVDGYDVDAKFLEPAISIRDLMWPRYKDTKLAFILDDGAKVLKKAQKAETESETQAALAELVTVLRPWIMTGAADHYRQRKIAFFKERKGRRVWLQLEGRGVNPYGRGRGVQVPWPDGSEARQGVSRPDSKDAAPLKSTAIVNSSSRASSSTQTAGSKSASPKVMPGGSTPLTGRQGGGR